MKITMRLPKPYWVLLLGASLCCVTFAGGEGLPERPPGAFFPLKASDHQNVPSFEAGRPVVGTTYFYWYDIETGRHIGDGVWTNVTLEDEKAVVSAANPHSQNSRYLYFDVDSAFAYDLYDRNAEVTVTYRDGGCTSFHLEYDNTNPSKGVHEGAFRRIGNVTVMGTGSWKTAEFVLPDCRLMNRCNGADFRLVVLGGDLEPAVCEVVVKRTKQTGERQ